MIVENMNAFANNEHKVILVSNLPDGIKTD
jgi:hypothetical protein